MKLCSILESIKSDLEELAEKSAMPLKRSYELDSTRKINCSVDKAEDSLILKVTGPEGAQEANLDEYDKVLGAAVLFICRQVSHCIGDLDLEPCKKGKKHSCSHELLALFKGICEFEEKDEMPFSYKTFDVGNFYELISVSAKNGQFKISLETRHLHEKTDTHVVFVESFDQVNDRLFQLVLFEFMTWLTPEVLKSAKQSAASQRKLPGWVIPALVACILTASTLSAAWLYLNQSKDWRKLEEAATKAQKVPEAIKLYHRAIVEAERAGASDEERLRLQESLVDFSRDNAPYETYLRESAKLIVIADLLGDANVLEKAMFRTAQDEFVREHFHKSLIQLQSVIPLVKKRRGDNFPGLIRAYEMLGRCYMEQGDIARAEESFRASVKVADSARKTAYDGSIGFSYFYLGAIAEKRGDFPAAIEFYRQAMLISSKLVRSKVPLSIVKRRFMELDPDEAMERVESKLKKK